MTDRAVLRHLAFINSQMPFLPKFKVRTRVRCFHCERIFFAYELRVVEDSHGFPWILCKFPGCDGSIIDMFPYDAGRESAA